MQQWGLEWNVAGLREFTQICVEAFAILEKALADLHDAGTLVVADAKRGDIGSTNKGYADAWLRDDSPLACDALTVSPYLGVASLAPLFTAAQESGKGLFVLARTSNPEGAVIQNAVTSLDSDERMENSETSSCSVAQYVVDYVSACNAIEKERWGIGSYGVVVGATVQQPPLLENLCGPVLLPGVGAQGATKDDVDRIVGNKGTLGIPNISRALLECGPSVEDLATQLSKFNSEYLA